jgi:hypothetical protein
VPFGSRFDQKETTMISRLRKHVIGVLAAATVSAAALANTPAASAMTWSCATRNTLYTLYMSVGDAYEAAGEYMAAAFWWGKAYGVLEGSGC